MDAIGIKTTAIAAVPPKDGSLGRQKVGFRRIRVAPTKLGYDRTISIISPSIMRELHHTNPDIVIAMEYSLATFWSLVFAKLFGRRIVIFQEHISPTSITRRIWRRTLQLFANHLIANTDGAYHQLTNHNPASKCSRINLLVPPSPDRDDVGCEKTIDVSDNERTIFLYVGQLIKRKNISTLIEAVHDLKARGHSSFRVIIAGGGSEESVLRQLTSEYCIDELVHFIGRVPYTDMHCVYRRCDIFIMPTWEDYRSVSVLEAMTYGMPIIDSTQDGNAGDSVKHEQNGYLFDPSSVTELSTAMENFITNPEIAEVMGESSRTYINDMSPDSAAVAIRSLICKRWPDLLNTTIDMEQ